MAPWALKGYERTAVLAPAASVRVSFTLTFDELSTVANDGSVPLTPVPPFLARATYCTLLSVEY